MLRDSVGHGSGTLVAIQISPIFGLKRTCSFLRFFDLFHSSFCLSGHFFQIKFLKFVEQS